MHDALAWLSQITMFLMLGLLVFPSRLFGVAAVGLALALFLALVARPAVVALCLLPFPEGAPVVLVVRGRELVAPNGDTVLEPGDHV